MFPEFSPTFTKAGVSGVSLLSAVSLSASENMRPAITFVRVCASWRRYHALASVPRIKSSASTTEMPLLTSIAIVWLKRAFAEKRPTLPKIGTASAARSIARPMPGTRRRKAYAATAMNGARRTSSPCACSQLLVVSRERVIAGSFSGLPITEMIFGIATVEM